jgi:hypothetical protein
MFNFKKLRRFFQRLCKSKAKRQRQAFREWQRTRPPSLPDVPTTKLDPGVKLVQQPITPIPYVPGVVLELDRTKRGLKTIRLEPFPWLEDESWLNSGLLPLPPANVQVSPVYEPPDVETEHMPAFVKALHERKKQG